MPLKPPAASRQPAALTRRAAKANRREEMLEDVVGGVERSVIARKNGVSLKTVYREVNRALDQRRLDTPDRYVRVQIDRLGRALQCIDNAILHGEVEAVPHLLKVIEKLDSYHRLGAREAMEARPPRVAPAPPLALSHERTESES